ncbi:MULTISPECIES: DUF6622 family protein [unclassified Pandoraea]|uniref:DUF6622 family protein n=1 Tax=unclassified Pandoraea TaxID=2624094 RepID=UPI000B40263D|nr:MULTISPECIES: DUF6622 family protein [unclassified Pandoraea]
MTFLSHVPMWVGFLFLALVGLGLSATRTQQKPLWAALAMPVAMTLFSAYGVANTFGASTPSLIAWTSAVVIVVVMRAALGIWGDVRWLPESRRVLVPGSWMPLVWMLAIFAMKFAVAVQLAMHPALHEQGSFAAWISLAYGAFTGVFLGRGLAIRRAIRLADNKAVPLVS